jgi:tetratricopeptide (TPR) repeat protein
MEGHLTRAALDRIFSGMATSLEIELAVPHLCGCRPCWKQASTVVAQLRGEGRLASNLAGLIEQEQQSETEALRADCCWLEMKDTLSLPQQIKRLEAVPTLRTVHMVNAVLDDCDQTAFSDPHQAEQEALLAQRLIALLPSQRLPQQLRSDLEGRAWTTMANCRRLLQEWKGAQEAIKKGEECFKNGSGDLGREARLLSVHASLCCDLGNPSEALALLSPAAANCRALNDWEGVARLVVQEAGTLFASGKVEEAMARAEEVLALRSILVSRRLEFLARSIITLSLASLDRPQEALLSFTEAKPLHSEFPEYRLRVSYLKARVLDSMGLPREAEKLLRVVARKNMNTEQYKEAFLTMLTLFEMHFKRGELDKAEEVCEETLKMFAQSGEACHAQMVKVWEELRKMVRERQLTDPELRNVRQYLVWYWSVPAPKQPFAAALAEPVAPAPPRPPGLPPAPEEYLELEAVMKPAIPAALSPKTYTDATEQYDKELISAALVQTDGKLKATVRLLGIARNTLRAKIRKYGLHHLLKAP